MREYGHSGIGGWLVGVIVGVLAVVVLTPVLIKQGLVPTLIFLVVMLPLVGWALRLAIQTATVKLVLTEDGYLERHGTFLPTLRVPVSRIRCLERVIVGDDPVVTLHYDHHEALDWRAGENELSDLIARIEAANPNVTVRGQWWGRPQRQL